MPRVSIGMPVHNGERYLRESLACLLTQTFEDFELVASDNASSDATPDILADAARQDRRIRVVRNPENIGAAPNWNRVFRLCSSPYFKWAAHDDLYDPRYLEATVAVLDRDPGTVLCHSRTRLVDEDGAVLRIDPATGSFVDRRGQLRAGPPTPGRATSPDPAKRFRDTFIGLVRCFDVFGVMRADALRRTPLHRSWYGSDRALLVELSLHGRFAEVPEALFLKREHAGTSLSLPPDQRVRWIDPKAREVRFMPQRRHYLQALGALLRAPLSPADRVRCLAVVAERAAGRLRQRRTDGAVAPQGG